LQITSLAQASPRKAQVLTNSINSSNDNPPPAPEPVQNGDTHHPNANDQTNLLHPPVGLLIKSEPACKDKVYAMKGSDLITPWKLAKIVEVKTKGKETKYKVQFESSSTKQEFKTLTLKQIAHEAEGPVCLPIGTRCIAVYKEDSKTDFYPAIVAEKPKAANSYRYLVFYDDGYASYLEHKDLRTVCKASNDVWLDVHPKRKELTKRYVQKYPKRTMLKLEEDCIVKTELRGNWYMARVFDVDASVVKLNFPDDLGCEWIYRGSSRFEPIILLLEQEQNTVNNGLSENREIVHEPTTQYFGGIVSEVQIEGNEPIPYVYHVCNQSCLAMFPYNQLEHKLSNPLRIPIYLGWRREVITHKDSDHGGNWTVMYITPCGRRLRNLEEIHAYLRMTDSNMEIDFFAFDCWLNVMKEFIPNQDFLKMEDISHGKEQVPIPAANSYNSTYPPFIEYTTKPNLQANVEIANDPNFLVGCNCTDDCQNTGRCECTQLTIQATKCDAGGRINKDAGYSNRRLQDVVLTGIYECNKTCSCSKTCLNRVVQFPIRSRLQIFKTENRGWGLRTLDDLPQGAFICNYVGNLYAGEEGNKQGTAFGDAYFADLDMIEVVEGRKEGYESDVSDEGFDEDTRSKSSDDRATELREVTHEKSKKKEQKTEEPKKIENAESGEQKHKSARKYFGPEEDIYIMDAMTHGNIGRYLNHSCDPNVFVQNVFVNNHDLRFPNIAFFTFKFVPAGTELCWNYNYEVGTVENKQIVCNCGANTCKGRLL